MKTPTRPTITCGTPREIIHPIRVLFGIIRFYQYRSGLLHRILEPPYENPSDNGATRKNMVMGLNTSMNLSFFSLKSYNM